jgi:hypothetical protein
MRLNASKWNRGCEPFTLIEKAQENAFICTKFSLSHRENSGKLQFSVLKLAFIPELTNNAF